MTNVIKKNIPNTVTCLNLFSGCIACVMAFEARYELALLFIILSSVFDFFDGMLARALNAHSIIGKDLDSLADDVSFGFAPSAIVFSLFKEMYYPASMEFIAQKENLDIAGMMNVLNKKSGLLGLSGGLSSDFRDLNDAAQSGNEDAANAIDVLCYGIAKFVGGYVAAMNGVDAIVFTAGIGENAIPVREKVVSYLGYLGVTLDKEANGVRGEEIVISTPDSKVKVAVIPTNEELAICRETVALV